jgi:hypothetical protein
VSNYNLTSSQSLSQNLIASSKSLDGSRKTDISKSPYKIKIIKNTEAL